MSDSIQRYRAAPIKEAVTVLSRKVWYVALWVTENVPPDGETAQPWAGRRRNCEREI